MFRRALDSLVKFVMRKELVGVDRNGNKYYRWVEKEAGNTGRQIERREVDFAVKGDYDPSAIPPEWVSWLHKFRKEPPSEEEIKRIQRDAEVRAARVAQLEEKERQRKYKSDSLESEGMASDAGPDMQRYIEQMTSLGFDKRNKE